MFAFTPVKIPRAAGMTRPLLDALARDLADAVDVPQRGRVTVAAVDGATIRRWNAQYRGKDAETDVLSFRYAADFASAAPDEVVGEILLCPDYVARQAAERGNALRAEWCRLLVHGAYHVLGYDHETDADFSVMEPLELATCARLGEKFGLDVR